MTTFDAQSKTFLRDLSRASYWMMRRSAGSNHWWRSAVLTSVNPDTDKKRPVFEQTRADEIFGELIERRLLVQCADDIDGTGVPVYLMRYDIDGWDKSVADGRPIYALCSKVRRTWFMILLTFIFGCVVTTVESRFSGALDGVIDRVLGKENEGSNQSIKSTPSAVTSATALEPKQP